MRKFLLSVLIFIFFALCSCGNNDNKEIQKQIEKEEPTKQPEQTKQPQTEGVFDCKYIGTSGVPVTSIDDLTRTDFIGEKTKLYLEVENTSNQDLSNIKGELEILENGATISTFKNIKISGMYNGGKAYIETEELYYPGEEEIKKYDFKFYYIAKNNKKILPLSSIKVGDIITEEEKDKYGTTYNNYVTFTNNTDNDITIEYILLDNGTVSTVSLKEKIRKNVPKKIYLMGSQDKNDVNGLQIIITSAY